MYYNRSLMMMNRLVSFVSELISDEPEPGETPMYVQHRGMSNIEGRETGDDECHR